MFFNSLIRGALTFFFKNAFFLQLQLFNEGNVLFLGKKQDHKHQELYTITHCKQIRLIIYVVLIKVRSLS